VKIVVYELIGEYATSSEEGQKLYDRTVLLLRAGESVELDFEEVQVTTTLFWNYAVGQLLRDFTPDTLNSKLKFSGLSPCKVWELKRAIDGAKQFYGVD
jgi:hypothetical protein